MYSVITASEYKREVFSFIIQIDVYIGDVFVENIYLFVYNSY